MIIFILCIIVAYLIGSISSAIIVCRVMGLLDPRGEGSGNPGATNVYRIGGKVPAAITLAGDLLKGLLPVLLAKLLGFGGIFLASIGLAAIIGHMYPIFYDFKGGKGIATALGVVLGLSLIAGILAATTWAIIALLFRYSSVAGMVTFILTPFYLVFFSRPAYFIPMAILAALILWRHKDNLKRIRSGTESKIG